MARKDLLTRLADAGEDAIARLADAPAADRLLGGMMSLRERMDDLQRRVRGLDELERRVAALEARLAEPPVPATQRRTPARKPAAGGGGRTGAARKTSGGARRAGGTTEPAKPAEPTDEKRGSDAAAGADSPG
jgi:hypothetical protein